MKYPMIRAAMFGICLVSASANAALMIDQNVTPDVIFGSGNANGSFTVDRENGVEVGLRGKLRHNASGMPENTFNSNGDGTYTFDATVAPGQGPTVGVWSFEWSINTDFDGSTGNDLDDLTYMLFIDQDPSLATSFNVFDPIAVGGDHAIGDNSTGNGGGTSTLDSTTYAALIADNNVAQNSWKATWFITNYDPTMDATFDFALAAFSQGQELARTSIQVIQGAGGSSAIPEPSLIALFSASLFGLVWRRRTRK